MLMRIVLKSGNGSMTPCECFHDAMCEYNLYANHAYSIAACAAITGLNCNGATVNANVKGG
eukprot:9206544-Karenia_brevis.AAC.1